MSLFVLYLDYFDGRCDVHQDISCLTTVVQQKVNSVCQFFRGRRKAFICSEKGTQQQIVHDPQLSYRLKCLHMSMFTHLLTDSNKLMLLLFSSVLLLPPENYQEKESSRWREWDWWKPHKEKESRKEKRYDPRCVSLCVCVCVLLSIYSPFLLQKLFWKCVPLSWFVLFPLFPFYCRVLGNNRW